MDRPALDGQSILVVEERPAVARALQAALEEAGAEVVVAHDARQALARVEQFDFSAAVLDWRPESREQRTVARWFEEEGVRFLFCAAEPPEDVRTARGAPILAKPTPPEEIVKALALLIDLSTRPDA